MKKDKRLLAAVGVNLAIIIMEIIAAVRVFSESGIAMLKFYTVESNVFALIACAVLLAYQLRELSGRGKTPLFAKEMKYFAVCCLMLTFLVALCVLTPMSESKNKLYDMMVAKAMIFHHTLCPLVSLLSLVLLDRPKEMSRRLPLFALLPTALYAFVTLTLNILRVMEGPYPFLMVYKQPALMSVVWCAAILLGAFAICYGIYRLSKGKTGTAVKAMEGQ
jgi:hypothetical protein